MYKILSTLLIFVSAMVLVACTTDSSSSNLTMASSPVPTLAMVTSPTTTPSTMPCTVLHAPATPVALGAEFGDRGHISGPENAPVTLVEFSDYQCPACAFLAVSLKQIRLAHLQDVRFVFINTPLSGHDKDELATQAVEAADLQGKFWEMHDLLFEKLADWTALAPGDFEDWSFQQAAGLGMDVAQYKSDFQGAQVAARLQQVIQTAAGQSIVPPVLFVNSPIAYSGLADFASLDTVVRMEALAARQFSDCPAWVIDPLKQYIATLYTSKGDVVIQLLPDKAPLAVNNFVWLARHGWYDGISFYKMIPDFLAMTGDPSETGMGNSGYLFETEISAGMRFDQAGMLVMDNSGPNTNGSRFFITLAPAPQLYGQYTVFGNVLSGMDVLSTLSTRDPKPGIVLPPGDTLIKVTITEH